MPPPCKARTDRPQPLAHRRAAGHLLGRGLVLALAVCWCAVPLAGESTAPMAINTITLEHNCFGCTAGSVLVLRRDGTAVYTVTGNARLGIANKSSTGTLATAEFDALARLAEANGFFQLDDQYEDPSTRDGAWTTIRIAGNGRDKQVFRREATGPAALKTVEQAIETAKGRIRFVAVP